jgi:hypothetical protein
VLFIESGDMINDAHATHFAADGFEHPRTESVSFRQMAERRQELPRGIFQLYIDSQEYYLVVSIPRKEQSGQVIQPIYPGNLAAIEIDLCARRVFHPPLSRPNYAFVDFFEFLGLLKFSSGNGHKLS